MLDELVDAILANLPGSLSLKERASRLTFFSRYLAAGLSLLGGFCSLLLLASLTGPAVTIYWRMVLLLCSFLLFLVLYAVCLVFAVRWEKSSPEWRLVHSAGPAPGAEMIVFSVIGATTISLLLAAAAFLQSFPQLNESDLWRNLLLLLVAGAAFLSGVAAILFLEKRENRTGEE